MATLNRIRPLDILDALTVLAPALGLGTPIHREVNGYHIWNFRKAGVMLVYEPDEQLPWRVQSTAVTTPSAAGSTDPEPERCRRASFDEAMEELGRAHAVTQVILWRRKQLRRTPPAYDDDDLPF